MHTGAAIRTEFRTAALRLANRSSDRFGHRTGLRVRHQAAGTELTAEGTDQTHRIRSRDQDIEILPAVFDLLNNVFITDEIGAGILGVLGQLAVGDDRNADRLAGAPGKRNRTADRLVGLARIDAELESDFGGLVEPMRLALLIIFF